MRRTERAVCTILGAGLSPLAAALNPAWFVGPIAVAVGVVGTIGNVSAVRRLVAIARAARLREERAQ